MKRGQVGNLIHRGVTMKIKFVLLLLLFFFLSDVLAGDLIYKWTDKSGVIHFSNAPPPSGSYEVLKPAPVIPKEDSLLRAYYEDPFSVAEDIIKTKKIRHYQLDLVATKTGHKFSVRIDLDNDILRVTMLEGNSATSYVREKFKTIATKWDPKSGRYYNVPVLNEFYRREFWAIRSAIGQEDPIGRLYGVRKGDPVLLHTYELTKQAAIAMLRQAGWVIYFLPKELQKEFFGE